MKKLITVILVLMQAAVYGEGLPLDENGNLDCPNTVVHLTASQQEEVVTMNSVTLTKDQWKVIRKVSPNTPKRLEGLISITHNDCTCGIGYAAVQLSRSKVAVLHSEQSAKSIAWHFKNRQQLHLRVDSRGQFYFDGILLRFPNLLKAIKVSEPYKQNDSPSIGYGRGSATIRVPMGMTPSDEVFDNRLFTVYQLLASKGWNSGLNPLKPLK